MNYDLKKKSLELVKMYKTFHYTKSNRLIFSADINYTRHELRSEIFKITSDSHIVLPP